MKYGFFQLVLLVLLSGSLCLASEQDKIVIIEELSFEGLVTIERVTGKAEKAERGQQLFVGDTIKTDAKSSSSISLSDGSVVKLSSNTIYKIQKISVERGLLSWAFYLFEGSVRALVRTAKEKGFIKFKILTSTGSIGVRGTDFIVSYSKKDSKTILHTLSGEVMIGPKGANFQKLEDFEIVRRGHKSSINKKQKRPTKAKLDWIKKASEKTKVDESVDWLSAKRMQLKNSRKALSQEDFQALLNSYRKDEFISDLGTDKDLVEKKKLGEKKTKRKNIQVEFNRPIVENNDESNTTVGAVRVEKTESVGPVENLGKGRINARTSKLEQDTESTVETTEEEQRQTVATEKNLVTVGSSRKKKIGERIKAKFSKSFKIRAEVDDEAVEDITATVLDTDAENFCSKNPDAKGCKDERSLSSVNGSQCTKTVSKKVRCGFLKLRRCTENVQISVPCDQLNKTKSDLDGASGAK